MSELFQYNTNGLLNLAAAFFDISVGFIVLLQNPRSQINQSFFFLTLNTCVWLTFFGMISLVKDPRHVYSLMAWDYSFGVPFIPVSFYFLSSYLLGRKDNVVLKTLSVFWAVLSALPMVLFTERLAKAEDLAWGRYVVFKTGLLANTYFLFLLIPFFTWLLLSFINFYRAWKSATSPKERVQTCNILIGVLIAYTGASDFLTAFQFPIYPFGYISLTIFIGIVSYTIVRHQFMEINVLLRKFSIIFLIYSFILAIIIPLSSIIIKKNFVELDSSQLLAIIGLGLLIGLAVSIGPLIYATILRHTFWLKSYSSTGLAHELKSPLGTIQSATQILLDHQTQTNPDKSKTFYLR